MTTRSAVTAGLLLTTALLAGCAGGVEAASPVELNPNACGEETFRTAHVEYCSNVDPLEEEGEGWDGPTSYSPPPPPTPTTFTVGTPVAFDGSATGRVTINSTRRVTSSELSYGGSAVSGSYLILDVSVDLTSTTDPDGLSVSYLNFTAQDTAGHVYTAEYDVVESNLSATIGAGRKVRGEVAFDIPKGEIFVDWSPSYGSPAVTWKFTA